MQSKTRECDERSFGSFRLVWLTAEEQLEISSIVVFGPGKLHGKGDLPLRGKRGKIGMPIVKALVRAIVPGELNISLDAGDIDAEKLPIEFLDRLPNSAVEPPVFPALTDADHSRPSDLGIPATGANFALCDQRPIIGEHLVYFGLAQESPACGDDLKRWQALLVAQATSLDLPCGDGVCVKNSKRGRGW